VTYHRAHATTCGRLGVPHDSTYIIGDWAIVIYCRGRAGIIQIPVPLILCSEQLAHSPDGRTFPLVMKTVNIPGGGIVLTPWARATLWHLPALPLHTLVDYVDYVGYDVAVTRPAY